MRCEADLLKRHESSPEAPAERHQTRPRTRASKDLRGAKLLEASRAKPNGQTIGDSKNLVAPPLPFYFGCLIEVSLSLLSTRVTLSGSHDNHHSKTLSVCHPARQLLTVHPGSDHLCCCAFLTHYLASIQVDYGPDFGWCAGKIPIDSRLNADGEWALRVYAKNGVAGCIARYSLYNQLTTHCPGPMPSLFSCTVSDGAPSCGSSTLVDDRGVRVKVTKGGARGEG